MTIKAPDYVLIQIAYPDEPNWEIVPDHVLLELVQHYDFGQDCATCALGELHLRKHPRTRELAHWLLSEEEADQWLKAYVQSMLSWDSE